MLSSEKLEGQLEFEFYEELKQMILSYEKQIEEERNPKTCNEQ